MRMEQGVSPMVTAGERAQAVASYARAFFRSMGCMAPLTKSASSAS